MTDTIYSNFVESKAKKGLDILSDLRGLDDVTARLVLNRVHGVVGLITELNEIQSATSDENIIEELGDYYFYLTLLKANAGPEGANLTVSPDITAYSWESARYAAGELLDLTAKREMIYARELTYEQILSFYSHLATVNGYFYLMLNILDMTEAEIQAHNMAKLNKRYKTGYSNEAAAARADKTEEQ